MLTSLLFMQIGRKACRGNADLETSHAPHRPMLFPFFPTHCASQKDSGLSGAVPDLVLKHCHSCLSRDFLKFLLQLLWDHVGRSLIPSQTFLNFF